MALAPKVKEKLEATIQKLNESSRKIVDTNGYSRDVSKVKALEELLREQLLSENSYSTTCKVR